MEIRVNITKTRFFVLLFAFLLVGAVVFVQGQTGSSPNPGHTVGELDLGNADLGTWVGGSNFAFFGNKILGQGVGNANNYALLQSNDGNTLINAAAGQSVHFRVDNVEKASVDSVGLKVGAGGITFNDGSVQTRACQITLTNCAYTSSGADVLCPAGKVARGASYLWGGSSSQLVLNCCNLACT